jgi:hypothetical protein
MATEVVVVAALLLAWIAWPRTLAYLWRRGRITPTVTTALLMARAPVVVGLGALIFGASPLVVLVAVGLMLLGSALFFRFFRQFLSDPRIT